MSVFINANNSTVTTTVNNSTFTNNTALNSGADSGAVSLRIGKLVVDGSTFTENKASEGGAIESYTNDNYMEISDSEFDSNEAGSFGAVSIFGKISVTKSPTKSDLISPVSLFKSFKSRYCFGSEMLVVS